MAEKIFSDIGERDTPLPYICFSEPEETEGYETPDSVGGSGSSMATGVFVLEVYHETKIAARQLADLLADYINDAPLEFLDGVLVYLRRSTRRYPTLRVLAPGTGVVQYKRVLEFVYMIERTPVSVNAD